jgi:hypothetical protein
MTHFRRSVRVKTLSAAIILISAILSYLVITEENGSSIPTGANTMNGFVTFLDNDSQFRAHYHLRPVLNRAPGSEPIPNN